LNNCAFTICAKNYIGLAKILEQSLKLYDPDIDFKIIIADEIQETNLIPENAFIAKNILPINSTLWQEMTFKYNLTEFCTAIKPFSFKYLFDKFKYEKIIYLDPDILVYSSINDIINKLDNYNIILTPHIVNFYFKYTGELEEKSYLNSGVFNLGFLALHDGKETNKFLSWWSERLIKFCYNEILDAYFTDQKWMDLIPCFFDSEKLFICRHPGYNIAPWNFFEREIFIENGEYRVRERNKYNNQHSFPIIFVHYSGFNYMQLLSGNVHHKNINSDFNYSDIQLLFEYYQKYLIQNKEYFEKYISLNYDYNYFDNNKPILMFHRRLFRGLLNKGEIIAEPFKTDNGSFYSILLKKKLILHDIKIEKITRYSINNIGKKLNFINKIFHLIFKLVGLKKFILFIKVLKLYSRFENQIYLINKKYIKNNLLGKNEY